MAQRKLMRHCDKAPATLTGTFIYYITATPMPSPALCIQQNIRFNNNFSYEIPVRQPISLTPTPFPSASSRSDWYSNDRCQKAMPSSSLRERIAAQKTSPPRGYLKEVCNFVVLSRISATRGLSSSTTPIVDKH